MQKINSAKLIFLMLFIPFVLNGCYDRYELNNLAYVVAIGGDVGENNEVNITYQVAVPVKITGEGSDTSSGAYTTYTVSAPSLSIGNTKLNAQISKELNLSHVEVIVYSEELARKGTDGHMNVFVSNTEIRPKVNLVVCKGKAQDLLEKVSPKLEVSPARYYELLFNTSDYTSEAGSSELIDFYNSVQSIDRNAFGVYVRLDDESGEKSELVQDGLAVFKGSKMVGVLDKEYLLAHLILTNGLKRTGFAVKDFKKEDLVISVHLMQRNSPAIKVTLDGDTPIIKCSVHLEAHLFSSGSEIDFHERKNLEKLENDLNEAIKENITEYFELTIHKFNSDIAGIGRLARANFLTWEEFENYKWLEKYKNSKYEIEVNTGLNVSQVISHKVKNTEI